MCWCQASVSRANHHISWFRCLTKTFLYYWWCPTSPESYNNFFLSTHIFAFHTSLNLSCYVKHSSPNSFGPSLNIQSDLIPYFISLFLLSPSILFRFHVFKPAFYFWWKPQLKISNRVTSLYLIILREPFSFIPWNLRAIEMKKSLRRWIKL